MLKRLREGQQSQTYRVVSGILLPGKEVAERVMLLFTQNITKLWNLVDIKVYMDLETTDHIQIKIIWLKKFLS